MNREDIIQMAQEAGFEELFKDSHDWVCFTEDIERFFQLATEWASEREREQCAKVCDDIFRHWLQTDPDEKFATPDADDCARAIRERSANAGVRGKSK